MALKKGKSRAPKDMVDAYIKAALWSSDATDNEGSSRGSYERLNFDKSNLSPAAKKRMEDDCSAFYAAVIDGLANELSSEFSYEQMGHDFWLTRNRHGAGFWDGDWPKSVEKSLTDTAHAFGEQHLWLDAEEKDGEITGGTIHLQ